MAIPCNKGRVSSEVCAQKAEVWIAPGMIDAAKFVALYGARQDLRYIQVSASGTNISGNGVNSDVMFYQ